MNLSLSQQKMCGMVKIWCVEEGISGLITRRRHVVHRWPAVPTAANKTDRTARERSASSITIIALFPLSSSNVLPCLACTILCTSFPTCNTQYVHITKFPEAKLSSRNKRLLIWHHNLYDQCVICMKFVYSCNMCRIMLLQNLLLLKNNT